MLSDLRIVFIYDFLLIIYLISVYDASAKIPSGILNGNVNQFGDFDQCVNVQGMEAIQGKYCLAYLQPVVPDNLMRLKHLSSLAQSHSAFRSNFDDVSMLIFFLLS